MTTINSDKSQKARTEFKEIVIEVATYFESLARKLSGGAADYDLQVVLFELLKRVTLNTSAICKLTDGFIENSNFKLPIYILLRTMIADAIVAAYLADADGTEKDEEYADTEPEGRVEFSEAEKTRFEERYNSLTLEALNKTAKQLDDFIKRKRITVEQKKEIIGAFKDGYSGCFDEAGNLRKNKCAGVKALTKGTKNSKGRAFANDIYSFYFQLSQYEHFSEVTVQLMDSEDAIVGDIDRMLGSLYFILRGVRATFICLNLATDKLDELISKIASRLVVG